MAYTVILVTALVIATCNGKVVITEDNLPDPSTNEIHKNDLEHDSNASTDSPTITHVDAILKEILPNIKLDAPDKPEHHCIANNSVDNEKNSETTFDTGVPLILTSLIENGLIEEARNKSRVDPSLFLGIESYSGFLTVNKTYNSNLFFWYFPVENKPSNATPWIIWLQGGPGASSLTGLFDEIGPFKALSGYSLELNLYTWRKNHSLLFIDNPIGSGYSFTDHEDGYAKDMATYSKHLYRTVQQFIQLFPELRLAPLYVAGESYAGKYVPALAMELHIHKNDPGHYVNLQGLIVGNGYIDPAMISQVSRPFYYFGLLEKEQIEAIEPLLQSFQRDIANNDSIAAKSKWTSLITILLFLSHQKQAYNFLKDEMSVGRYLSFLKRPDIKKAIHVGETNFTFVNFTTNLKLAPDFLSSSKSMIEILLEDYRVLAYCGQLDQMLPCVFTSENYRTWNWKGKDEFLRAARYPFIFNNRLAGYSKSGGGLTEAVMRGAGHMVPVDEPAPIQGLVARWTHGVPITRHSEFFEGNFVLQFIANNSAIYL